MAIISFHPEFRPALPSLYGPKDYRDYRSILEEMDRLLTTTGVEAEFIARHIRLHRERFRNHTFQKASLTLRSALRYSIVLAVTGKSYRRLAFRICDSHVFQWFTHASRIDNEVRTASKSAIERFEKMFSEEEITTLIHALNRSAADIADLRLDYVLSDTFCVKANIHFPVDWVLLRDAVRTLIKAIELIRSYGIKHRISEPAGFIRQMNKLCIEMTHLRKKRDAPKKRKTVLRRMKRLAKTVERHAVTYHRELAANWNKTRLSQVEAQAILKRMENILKQLPWAIQQAHERIIGERRVKNQDKILSLYEPDTHVMVRGKAGAEVEFGNALYLAEQVDGLIIDWDFIKDQPPHDSKLLPVSLKRITAAYGKPAALAADRAFDSPANRQEFETLGIVNAICPRSTALLNKMLEDETFCRLQKRRGGTEARISIFKNVYLGSPLRSKGFANRYTRILWCVLAHNLWKIASMIAEQRNLTEIASTA